MVVIMTHETHETQTPSIALRDPLDHRERFEIVDGYLWYCAPMPAYGEPILHTRCHKVARACDVSPDLDGVSAAWQSAYGGSVYVDATEREVGWALTRVRFALPGYRPCEAMVSAPIPAPKTRGKPARYRNGRWQKLLARGWVDA
jgi:hypothetical protein